MLFLNHLAIALGFVISPCRLRSISEEKTFENMCLVLSSIRLFTIFASFSWKILEHVYIQFGVAKVRNSSHNMKNEIVETNEASFHGMC